MSCAGDEVEGMQAGYRSVGGLRWRTRTCSCVHARHVSADNEASTRTRANALTHVREQTPVHTRERTPALPAAAVPRACPLSQAAF
eukprot:6187551-Pleurochrysis_carterae.AAC.1